MYRMYKSFELLLFNKLFEDTDASSYGEYEEYMFQNVLL